MGEERNRMSDFSKLKTDFGFEGAVFTPSDPSFDAIAFGGLWNKLRPGRHPQIIAQVQDEADVAVAVKFTRASQLKVTVRGGGHNWCASSLRDSGMLIDLAKLNKIVSVNPSGFEAIVQPIVSNREIQAILNRDGLSSPAATALR